MLAVHTFLVNAGIAPCLGVAKLRGARERQRAAVGKCEGRKGHLEGEVVREAKRLRRRSPKTGRQRSLREIAAELSALGHLNTNSRPF
ncbi:MAG: hypothetical protein ABW003_15510 [Microvirga sp.]